MPLVLGSPPHPHPQAYTGLARGGDGQRSVTVQKGCGFLEVFDVSPCGCMDVVAHCLVKLWIAVSKAWSFLDALDQDLVWYRGKWR